MLNFEQKSSGLLGSKRVKELKLVVQKYLSFMEQIGGASTHHVILCEVKDLSEAVFKEEKGLLGKNKPSLSIHKLEYLSMRQEKPKPLASYHP